MIRFALALAAFALLTACGEPPKHQIVFVLNDTCKIIIYDLQYGQANATERPCSQEKTGTAISAVTVNFLSETCNAYRYSFKAARENSDGVFVFKPEQNEPNPHCRFLPQYSDPNVEWVLNPK
jgi:hypothetical protein